MMRAARRRADEVVRLVDRSVLRWSTEPVRLRGMAMCRIFLGIAGIDFYLSNFGQRDLLFGPDGMESQTLFHIAQRHAFLPSLYGLAGSTAWFHLLYGAGIVVAVLFTVIGGRPLTAAHGIFLWSLYDRNGLILDGGDNLAAILAVLLLAAVTDAYYSPVAGRRRRQLELAGEGATEERTDRQRFAVLRRRATVLLHNAAVGAITFQIAILYCCAGLWKVAGGLWQDGTAMYYVSRTLDFRFVPLGWLATNAVTVTALSYFAIVANLGFPFGIVVSRARPITVGNALMMHLGIIVVMGLVGFGVTMIGADLACLTDDEYLGLRRAAGRAWSVVTRTPPAVGRGEGSIAVSMPDRPDRSAVPVWPDGVLPEDRRTPAPVLVSADGSVGPGGDRSVEP